MLLSKYSEEKEAFPSVNWRRYLIWFKSFWSETQKFLKFQIFKGHNSGMTYNFKSKNEFGLSFMVNNLNTNVENSFSFRSKAIGWKCKKIPNLKVSRGIIPEQLTPLNPKSNLIWVLWPTTYIPSLKTVSNFIQTLLVGNPKICKISNFQGALLWNH